ncbi:MAG: hypothetical protein IJ525_03590 [Alphaproteobacteria bacterium]|nr:hypothetical protein [Alphaproteobacteria bacterium]
MKKIVVRTLLILISSSLLSGCSVTTSNTEKVNKQGLHIVEKCVDYKILFYTNRDCTDEVIRRYY